MRVIINQTLQIMTLTKYIALVTGLISLGFLATNYYLQIQKKNEQMSRNEGGRLDKINDDTYLINLDPSSCRVDIETKIGERSLFESTINERRAGRTRGRSLHPRSLLYLDLPVL